MHHKLLQPCLFFAFVEISIGMCSGDPKTRDVHVHFVEQMKSGKVSGPNFHNISNVETRETISSIHCRMKEYISKICLGNTMIKQKGDELKFSDILEFELHKNILV